MPTIAQLPGATQAGLQDELPIEQAGVTRAVTVAELLSGTQPLLTVPSPCVLGRASLGPGGVETLALGTGVAVQAAALIATGADHASFAQESGFAPTDDVIVNASGAPRRLPVPALRGLFSAGRNVSIDTNGVIASSTDASVSGSLTILSQGLSAAQSGIATLAAKIPAGGVAGLNGSGQVTAPVAGDASAATVVSAAGGSPRTLSARTSDILNVLDFGAVAGGPDCSAAFLAAFNLVPHLGGEIWVPPGDYWLTSPLVLSGKPVSLRGSGRGQTRVHLAHTGVGFDFAPGSVFSKVRVEDLSIYAESMAGQTAAAVRVSYPAISSFGYVTTIVAEVEFFSYPNVVNGTAPFPQTFLRGLVLNNCWSSQISNLSWFGPPAAAGSSSSAVVELNGSIDTRIHGVQAYYGNTVVLQTGYCEGIYLSSPLVVGVDYLVRQTNITQWPGYVNGKVMLLGLWVADGEVNTNLGTFQISNATDGFIANLDITRDGGPNTGQVFLDFTNIANFHVTGCNFVGGSPQDVAIQFKSTFNSSSNIIGSCHFENMATVISVLGSNGTVALTTYALQFGNVPIATAFIDQTPQEASNYVSFMSPSQTGIPASIGNTKDHVWSGATGGTLFRINNVANAVNFLRHQPATSNNPPTLCFDGSDPSVGGVIQTKGGSLSVSASGVAGNGNLVSLLNVASATNWIVMQNASAGNLSLLGTNSGGLGIQPKGALWLSPGGGLFAPGLPTTKPASGSGQVWNNGGILSIA